MGVWLTRGDGDGDMCCIRKHEHCTIMTDWWWGKGCIPCCFACATLDEVTDASMRDLAKRDGWGPIPAENTDRHYPAPRQVVGDITNKRLHPGGFYVCDLACSHCGYTHHVAFGGWSAIGCPCGTDVFRSEAAMR